MTSCSRYYGQFQKGFPQVKYPMQQVPEVCGEVGSSLVQRGGRDELEQRAAELRDAHA